MYMELHFGVEMTEVLVAKECECSESFWIVQ